MASMILQRMTGWRNSWWIPELIDKYIREAGLRVRNELKSNLVAASGECCGACAVSPTLPGVKQTGTTSDPLS